MSRLQCFCIIGLIFISVTFAASAAAQQASLTPRNIEVDLSRATHPLDRFFDLSVGSDFPGTLIRDDSQAQLKTTVDELGFRYIRFHAIFHDVLGTVRVENGKTIYNWSRIDQLYDDLLARRIRPFVELGFTPKVMATSQARGLEGSDRRIYPPYRGALWPEGGPLLVF